MRLTTAAVVAAVILAPAVAHAQLGGLARRVAERVAKEQTSPGKRAPITDDAIAHALAGFAEEARAADEIGRAAVAAHAADVRAIDDYLKREAAYLATQQANAGAAARYEACAAGGAAQLNQIATSQAAAVTPSQAAYGQAMMQRMMSLSPQEQEAMAKKLEALEKDAKAAEKSGNVAEQRRLAHEMETITGVALPTGPGPSAAATKANADRAKAAESAAASIQKCGTPTQTDPGVAPVPPTVPAVAMRGQTLAAGATETIRDSASARSYMRRLRMSELGDRAAARGASAAGLSVGDYGLLREELLIVWARRAMAGPVDRGSGPQAFTDDELRRLEQHRDAILAAARRLDELGAL